MQAGKRVAGHILLAIRQHAYVVFDSNATEAAQPGDAFRVDHLVRWCAFEILLQYVDGVQTRFYREYLVFFQCAGEPQKRVAAGTVNGISLIIGHEATDIVNLQAKEMTEAMWVEGCSYAAFDECIGAAGSKLQFAQKRGDVAMGLNMQLHEAGASANAADEFLL